MKLPIVSTRSHLGKSLELDCERETITLVGPAGEELGTVSWESVIDQLLTQATLATSPEIRSQTRVALTFKVRYHTPQGHSFEGQAGGIGGGGLFIESSTPLPVGTKLSMEFALPTSPTEWLETKGIVAWVCPKSDQYTFSPGMGVQFTDISSDARGRVQDLVQLQRRTRQSV